MPDFEFEKKHSGLIAGIDEAGRGPWAGPVVAREHLPTANYMEDPQKSNRLIFLPVGS